MSSYRRPNVVSTTLATLLSSVALRTWLWLTIASVAIGASCALVVGSQQKAVYFSEVSIYVGPPLGGAITSNDIQVGQSLRQTFADLAATRLLLERVASTSVGSIDVSELARQVQARVPSNSNLLLIGVERHDPDEAARLANRIAAELATIAAPGTAADASNIKLTVIDPAVAPSSPVGPSLLIITLMGGGIGLIFAITVAFALENLRADRRRGANRG